MSKYGILIAVSFFFHFIIIQGADNETVRREHENRIDQAAGDSLLLLEAHFAYGEYLDEEGEMELSAFQFENALRIACNIEDNAKIASVGNYLANIYAMLGDFKASNYTYSVALEGAEKIGDSGEIAKISMNLAANYNFTGYYDDAIKYGLNALKIKESTNNLERICYHYIVMGNIFRENDNTSKWEEYVQKAYRMKDAEGCASLIDITKIYNSLGGIEVQKEDYDKALLYYDTLMLISSQADYYQGVSAALTNSAGVFRQMGDAEKALELALEAEQYFGENPYDIIFSNNFKAELYQQLGQHRNSLDLAKKNINIDEIEHYSGERLKCLLLLYEENFILSDYEQACYWSDSLRKAESFYRDEDVRQSIEELETRYETEKKEQKIELLTAENRLKNQRINAGIGIMGALLVVIFLISYIQRIRKKQAALVQNDLQQQVLRSQMNPHFIFNVLGSIQNYMLQNDTRAASGYLAQFASLTRATLENSAAESISLGDEIGMLKDYIELEKMRSPGKFDFVLEYDDDLELDLIQIPPMLVQPFVENSIKHGFRGLDRKGLLELGVFDKGDWVEFSIQDNGGGIQKEWAELKKHQSMALEIFEKRSRLIQHKIRKEFSYKLENLKDLDPGISGVKVSINIPILNND